MTSLDSTKVEAHDAVLATLEKELLKTISDFRSLVGAKEHDSHESHIDEIENDMQTYISEQYPNGLKGLNT